MSFLTATNTELIYNMTAAGPDCAVSTFFNLTPNTGNAVAPAYLPPVFSIWQPSSVIGKGFRVVAAGIYDTGSVIGMTMEYALQTAQATATSTAFSSPIDLAKTGSSNFPQIAAGSWYMTFDITFTAVTGANLTGFSNGYMLAGSANNAGTSTTTTSSVTMLGGSTSAGATTNTFTTWSGTTAYYWALGVTASAAPTHMALQQHLIFGLN